MESAIRLIESQNDLMEERRRAAVVVGAASSAVNPVWCCAATDCTAREGGVTDATTTSPANAQWAQFLPRQVGGRATMFGDAALPRDWVQVGSVGAARGGYRRERPLEMLDVR
jgi:hypothetical protein